MCAVSHAAPKETYCLWVLNEACCEPTSEGTLNNREENEKTKKN
jgi:hypothetical protein